MTRSAVRAVDVQLLDLCFLLAACKCVGISMIHLLRSRILQLYLCFACLVSFSLFILFYSSPSYSPSSSPSSSPTSAVVAVVTVVTVVASFTLFYVVISIIIINFNANVLCPLSAQAIDSATRWRLGKFYTYDSRSSDLVINFGLAHQFYFVPNFSYCIKCRNSGNEHHYEHYYRRRSSRISNNYAQQPLRDMNEWMNEWTSE